MFSQEPTHNPEYRNGIPECQVIYPLFCDLITRGFTQADGLSASLQQMNSALSYLFSGSDSVGRDKLSMCSAYLHQSAELLASSEFPNLKKFAYSALKSLQQVSSGEYQDMQERITLLHSGGADLKKAILIAIDGANKLIMEGYGSGENSSVESLRNSSVTAVIERIKRMQFRPGSLYLADAFEFVFQGLIAAERKERASSAHLLQMAGGSLTDAERCFRHSPTSAYEREIANSCSPIVRKLNEVRDLVKEGRLFEGRKRFFDTINAAKFL